MLDLHMAGTVHEVPPGCPDEIAVFEIIEEEPELSWKLRTSRSLFRSSR